MDRIPFYRRFRFRLVLFIVVIQLLFLSVSAIYTLRKQSDAETLKALNSNESSIKIATSYVNNTMAAFEQNLNLMAVTPALASFDPTESGKFLKTYKVSSLFITGERLTLYDNNNKFVADNWMVGGSRDTAGFEEFANVEPLNAYMGKIKWENYSPMRSFAVTVQNYARANGVLVADFSFRRLHSFLSEFKVGEQGHLILIDNLGRIIYHPDSKWTRKPTNMSALGFPELNVKEYSTEEPTYVQLNNGISYMINYRYENQTGIGIMTLLPCAEIDKQASVARRSMLYLYGAMMFFMLVLITWMSTLLLKPLVVLTEKMRLVQDGDLDVESGIKREDEIGLLASVFDTMRISIKQYVSELGAHRDRLELEVAERTAELEKANKVLELMSRTDDLTGIPNRRDIMEKIKYEMHRSRRSNLPFAFIIGDIDKFKSFNDTYGHDCGDEVLRSVAQTMRSMLRKHDYIARWGGEEFLLVLPETSEEGAMVVAQRVRAKVAETQHKYGDLKLSVTITLGVALFDVRLGIERSISLADRALYEGKEQGRNRVVYWDPARITPEELAEAAKDKESRSDSDAELDSNVIFLLDQERKMREERNQKDES